jgi:hypothetical protein
LVSTVMNRAWRGWRSEASASGRDGSFRSARRILEKALCAITTAREKGLQVSPHWRLIVRSGRGSARCYGRREFVKVVNEEMAGRR